MSPPTPRRRGKTWLTAAIITAMVLAFLFGGNGLWYTLKLRRRVDILEARVDSLARVNFAMQERLEGLQAGDPEALEEEARGYKMVKPGEKVYIMVPESRKK